MLCNRITLCSLKSLTDERPPTVRDIGGPEKKVGVPEMLCYYTITLLNLSSISSLDRDGRCVLLRARCEEVLRELAREEVAEGTLNESALPQHFLILNQRLLCIPLILMQWVKYWTVLRGHRVFFFKTNDTSIKENVCA